MFWNQSIFLGNFEEKKNFVFVKNSNALFFNSSFMKT